MQGWLAKKGKKHFFVLIDAMLLWFTENPHQDQQHYSNNAAAGHNSSLSAASYPTTIQRGSYQTDGSNSSGTGGRGKNVIERLNTIEPIGSISLGSV